MRPAMVDALKRAADDAERAESDFRRDIAARTKALERERAFAYRRLNIMRMIAEVVESAKTEEEGVAGARAALRARIGWSGEDENRAEVLERFEPVSKALFASALPDEKAEAEPPDVLAALNAFETWYANTHPLPFWELFEHYMPETPRVDF